MANTELLSPVLGILVASPKLVVADVPLGRTPGLSPKPSWVVDGGAKYGTWQNLMSLCCLGVAGLQERLDLQLVLVLPVLPTGKSC
ncbi:hypothetical protein DF270_16075 [Listeria monocytogenes]|nr:hypothetical protein DF270_16075 [Listeria monocytogenes]